MIAKVQLQHTSPTAQGGFAGRLCAPRRAAPCLRDRRQPGALRRRRAGRADGRAVAGARPSPLLRWTVGHPRKKPTPALLPATLRAPTFHCLLQILEEDPQLASYSKPLVGVSALHAAAGETAAAAGRDVGQRGPALLCAEHSPAGAGQGGQGGAACPAKAASPRPLPPPLHPPSAGQRPIGKPLRFWLPCSGGPSGDTGSAAGRPGCLAGG